MLQPFFPSVSSTLELSFFSSFKKENAFDSESFRGRQKFFADWRLRNIAFDDKIVIKGNSKFAYLGLRS